MTIFSTIKSFADSSYKLSNDPGKMLLIVGALGWLFSSAAQVAAIMVNNKIPEDQKKFLIPQEIADGVVNVASFLILTESCTKLGKYLVNSGKLITPEISKFLERPEIKSEIAKKGKDFRIGSLPQLKELGGKFDEKFSPKYNEFATGITFIASTIGSIISCNLITPYLRNKIGAHFQKIGVAKDKANLTPIDRPVLPMQNRFGIENYMAKKAYPTNSGLKI